MRGVKAAAQGAGLSEEEASSKLSVMGDDPGFLRIFNHVGSMFRKDVLITGAQPKAPEKSMEDLIAEQFSS